MCTPEDKQLLLTRTINVARGLSEDILLSPPWCSCTHYFPSLDEVNSANKEILLRLFPDITDRFDVSPQITINGKLLSVEEVKEKYGKKVARNKDSFQLAVGARVMINYNVNADWSIINGTLGEVAGYISKNVILLTIFL
jgi:hypothetical protein